MALRLEKEINNTGLTGDYWKIIEVYIHYTGRASKITLAQYASSEERLAGKSSITSVEFDWNGDNFPFDDENSSVRRTAYLKIKTLDGWTDSEDC